MNEAGCIDLGIENPGMENRLAGFWFDYVSDHIFACDSESAMPFAEHR